MQKKVKNRVRSQKADEANIAKFKALLENAYDGIVLYDAEGVIQYASPSIKKFGGYHTHDLIGRRGTDFIHEDDRAKGAEIFRDLLSKPGGSVSLVQRLLAKDGSYLWAEYVLTNLLDNPNVRGIVSNFRNIHEHKIAVEQARQNQQMLDLISTNINEAIYRSSEQRIIYVNEAFLQMFGYDTLEEVTQLDPKVLYARSDRKKLFTELKKVGKISSKEMQYKRKDGSIFWGLLTCSMVKSGKSEVFVDGAIRDISRQRQAEEELRRSQEFISSINRNITEGIFRSDGTKFHYVNHAFAGIFGYNGVEEMLNTPPRNLYANIKDRHRIIRHLKTVGNLTNMEVLYKKKSGDQFWGLVSYTRVKGKGGELFMDGVLRDITIQKQSEDELRNSQELLSSINKNINEGIYRSVPGKGFKYVNPAFLELFGYKSLQDLNKADAKDLYADRQSWKSARKLIAQNGEVRNLEVVFKKKNGEKFWGSMSSTLIKHRAGSYIDGAIRDISKQKESEQQLIDSRNFIDNVMKTVAAPIFVKDEKHRWIMFNDAFCWFMGKSRKALQGKTDKDFIKPEEVKGFWAVDNQVLKTGEVALTREDITLRKGGLRHLLTVKSRYINEFNEKFVIGFITDITEMRRAEDRLQELNANLQGIMESTHESIYALDRNFCYLAFNKNHARMAKLLYGVDIKIGDSKLAYISKTTEAKWLIKDLKRAMKGEHFVNEERVSHRGYRNRFLESTYNPIFGKNGEVTGVAVFVHDITEMHMVRKTIGQTNATMAGVLESTKDQIIAVDRKYRYLLYNKSHEVAVRRGTGGIVDKGANVLDMVPKERRRIAKVEIDRCLRGENFTSEYYLKDAVVLEALYNSIRDSSDNIIGVAIFMRDITARKQTEKRLKVLNEELIQQNWQLAAQEEELKATLDELSERNFELDQLMYKTSHDLRSPLSSILGLVHLAHLDTDKGNGTVYLNKIEGRIKKLDEFIKSMLTYAQVNRRDTNYELINLERLARASVRELDHLDNFGAIKVSIASTGKVAFRSDTLRVRIVFSNIISNAFKYFNPGVRSYLKIQIDVKPDAAVIVFKDNGIGIQEEHIGKVFDMFYRATERSQGSGLGMYIVKQAVEKLNGRITVKSTYGRGTTFRVTLPNY